MRRLRDLAGDAALACGVALLWAAPDLPRLATHVRDGYDALFHAWNLAWIRHAFATAPLRVFDANQFAPLPRTLAYSDPFLGCGVLSVPFAPFGPVAALNLTILLLLAASLFAVIRLARALGASRAAAVVGGAAASLGALLASTWGYLPFPAFGGIALLALAWRRLLARQRWRDAAALGLAAGLFGWVSLQLLAFAAAGVAVLAAVDLLVLRPRPDARLAARVLAAAGVALVVVLPVALPLLAVRGGGALRQSPEEMLRYSATLRDWGLDLYPGTAALLLAAVALLAAPRRRPPALLAGSVLALAGFALSFGPRGPAWLLVHGPAALAFGSIRSFTRFAFVAQAGLALMAAAGVDALSALALQRTGRARRAVRAGLVAGTALLAAWSVGSAPRLPFRPEPRPAAAALADRLPSPVLHFPFRARASDAWWLFASIPGFHPLVNGYTSFTPAPHAALAEALAAPELGDAMLGRLAAWPARTLVVHEHVLPLAALTPTLRMLALGLREGRIGLVAEIPHDGGVDDVLVFGAPRGDASAFLARADAARPAPEGAETDFFAGLDTLLPERGIFLLRGWSQTTAGPSEIVDVTIDGQRRLPLSSARVPRPDACAAFPQLGECSRAGFEIRYALRPEDAGRHSVRMVLRTPDGRWRNLDGEFVSLP